MPGWLRPSPPGRIQVINELPHHAVFDQGGDLARQALIIEGAGVDAVIYEGIIHQGEAGAGDLLAELVAQFHGRKFTLAAEREAHLFEIRPLLLRHEAVPRPVALALHGRGFDVTVLEKNPKAGGRCDRIELARALRGAGCRHIEVWAVARAAGSADGAQPPAP